MPQYNQLSKQVLILKIYQMVEQIQSQRDTKSNFLLNLQGKDMKHLMDVSKILIKYLNKSTKKKEGN